MDIGARRVAWRSPARCDAHQHAGEVVLLQTGLPAARGLSGGGDGQTVPCASLGWGPCSCERNVLARRDDWSLIAQQMDLLYAGQEWENEDDPSCRVCN